MALADDRSFAAVLKDIAGNLQEIIRGEIHLATVEVRGELSKARRAGLVIVVGGLFAMMAFGFLLLAVMQLLTKVVEPWIAALIVATLAAGVGGALVAMGSSRLKRVALPPPQTIDSVRESFRWAKAHTK